MSSPVTETRKSTLTLTREQLLTKFGESKHTIIGERLALRNCEGEQDWQDSMLSISILEFIFICEIMRF